LGNLGSNEGEKGKCRGAEIFGGQETEGSKQKRGGENLQGRKREKWAEKEKSRRRPLGQSRNGGGRCKWLLI